MIPEIRGLENVLDGDYGGTDAEQECTCYWSRRINDEHRLVYKSPGDAILIAQLRYHYGV